MYIDWTNVFNSQESREAYTNFYHHFHDAFTYCCPMKKQKHHTNYVKYPWITSGILNYIKRKNKLYTKLKQKHTINNKTM